MYNVTQFRQYIETTLKTLSTDTGKPMYSEEAVDLLMMTAAHESRLGTYLWQVNGPAKGAFMVEPETWLDTLLYIERKRWERCIPWPSLDGGCYGPVAHNSYVDPLNLRDSIVIARLHYWRVSEPLPKKEDHAPYRPDTYYMALAQYAKDHYNTALGKATANKYRDDYVRYVLDR